MTKRQILRVSGWSLLVLVIVGTLVAAGLMIRSTSREVAVPPPSSENPEEIVQELRTLIEEDEQATQEERNRGSSTATLESLRENGNEFGVAVRTFNAPENQFEVEIIAQLGDPQPGSSYVATLVNDTDSLEIGSLTKELENTFSLSYQSNNSLDSYTGLKISEVGTSVKTALSGNFE